MMALGVVLRGVFAVGSFLIVLAGAADAWYSGQPLLAVIAFVAYPITYFVYPWIGGLQLLWLVSMAAFVAGNVLMRAAGERS
jgi:hypothetical protein